MKRSLNIGLAFVGSGLAIGAIFFPQASVPLILASSAIILVSAFVRS